MSCGVVDDTREELRVVRADVEDVFVITGELSAVRADYLTVPAISEAQIKWLAPDGSRVSQGDLVAEFDDTGVLSRLEELRSGLLQTGVSRQSRVREIEAQRETKRAALAKAQIDVEKARLDAEVPRDLRSELEWRDFQAALSEKQAALEKARLDLEAFEVTARADLAGLEAAENKARREMEAAEDVLAAVSLEAPRDGLFVVEQHRMGQDRKYQPGDNVYPGMAVASIPDPSEMEVTGRLPEVDWGRIRPGQVARVVLDTWPERVFDGEVADVVPVASRQGNVGGYPVRIRLARTEPEIMRPRLSVRVEIVRERWEGVLSVPRAAVSLAGEATRVLRPDDELVSVELLGCTPTVCAIASGVEEGTRVQRF